MERYTFGRSCIVPDCSSRIHNAFYTVLVLLVLFKGSGVLHGWGVCHKLIVLSPFVPGRCPNIFTDVRSLWKD